MRRQLIWALALVLAIVGVSTAQETTSGSLVGEVVDNQGGAVPGATVTVTSNQGARTAVTDSNGRFYVPFLTPGIYAVKVELTGFTPVEQKNIQVRLGQRHDLGAAVEVLLQDSQEHGARRGVPGRLRERCGRGGHQPQQP